jgi:hypothetical protein
VILRSSISPLILWILLQKTATALLLLLIRPKELAIAAFQILSISNQAKSALLAEKLQIANALMLQPQIEQTLVWAVTARTSSS